MRVIRAGDLDREIEIEELVTTINPDYGSVDKSYRFLAKVWAKYTPFAASDMAESLVADSMRAIELATFTIRYFPNLSPTMRIIHDGKIYNVKSILDPGEKRQLMLDIVAKAEIGAVVTHTASLPKYSVQASTNPPTSTVSP